MNRRGSTNEHFAQDGWRAPVAQAISPNGRHPIHAAPRLPPPPAAAFNDPHQGSTGANARPAFLGPVPAPHAAAVRPDGAARQAGLWWLQSGAPTCGVASDTAPVAPAPSALDGQLRALTAQIEAVRHRSAAPVAAKAEVQQTLDEIVAPLLRAVPFRAIESLESSIVALDQRIDASRTSGAEPHRVAPIEHGLSEVRGVLHQLKPHESLAAFQSALQHLTDRLGPGRGTRQVSPKPQIEAVIASLHDGKAPAEALAEAQAQLEECCSE